MDPSVVITEESDKARISQKKRSGLAKGKGPN